MVTEEALHPLPALYHHCEAVYKAMDEKAEEDDQGHRQYTGFLTKEFPKLQLSQPYYTKVMQALIAMDCVRQRRRGGGSAPSEWLVVQPPSRELWPLAEVAAEAEPKTQPNSQAMRDINERLIRVEEALGIHGSSVA